MQTGSRLVLLFARSGGDGGGSVFHGKYKTPCFLSRSPDGCFYVWQRGRPALRLLRLLQQAAEFIFIPNLNLMNVHFAEFAPPRNERIMKARFNLRGNPNVDGKFHFWKNPLKNEMFTDVKNRKRWCLLFFVM